ncbi:hypothetical protein NL676_001531 [Syzygium grande]|nr:hypothetical protein NL676_001531 [Syzygium grande]
MKARIKIKMGSSSTSALPPWAGRGPGGHGSLLDDGSCDVLCSPFFSVGGPDRIAYTVGHGATRASARQRALGPPPPPFELLACFPRRQPPLLRFCRPWTGGSRNTVVTGETG